MYRLSVSVILFSEISYNVDFSDKPNPAWHIKVRKKGEPLFKAATTSITRANTYFISFENIIVLENQYDEIIIQEKLKELFTYLTYKKIDGKKNVYFSYIVENEQFYFELSPEFMQNLVDNEFTVRVSGIYFR